MKNRKIITFLFISILYSTVLTAENFPDINLSAGISKSTTSSSYELNYSINFRDFDPSAYMEQVILYPDEFLIAEGSYKNGVISEKDFLSSERDYDLNGDGDTSDTFSVKSRGGHFIIAGKEVSPLYKKINSGLVLVPLDEGWKENKIRLADGGRSFTIHSINIFSGKITAGIGKNGEDVVFKKYPNSLLIIEIAREINSRANTGIIIDNSKTVEGITNETIMSSTGEPLARYSYMTRPEIDKNRASGIMKIDNLSEPFSVRIKYCFALSGRIIIVSEKIIKIGKE